MHDLFAIGEVAEPEPVDRVRMPPTSSASSSHISRSIHSSGFDRRVHDFYATPNWVTEALLRHVQFRGRVWEPCCGTGAITSVLQRHGYDVTSTDIADHGFGTPGVDFLKQLDEIYAHLRDREVTPAHTSTITAPVEHLDLAPVIKVSQAI